MGPNSVSGESTNESQERPTIINTAHAESSPQVSTITAPSIINPTSSFDQNESISTGMPKTPDRHVFSILHTGDGGGGYDSDGQPAPWEDNNESSSDPLIVSEEALGERETLLVQEEGSNQNPTPTASTNECALTVDVMMKMKVPELKEELRKRGIGGLNVKKGDLQSKLREAVENNIVPVLDQQQGGTGAQGGSSDNGRQVTRGVGDGFDVGAYWEVLEQDGDKINEEDLRDVDGVEFRAPTEPENETREQYQTKRNYSHRIDRRVFTGKATLPKFWRGRLLATNQRTKEVLYEEDMPVEDTTPNINWCKSKGLDLDSHPVHWFDAFLPVKNKRGDNSYTMSNFSIENALSWTNTKAQMMNAGLGGKYDDFTNFSLMELMKHIGLYLFHGLSPSPQVEMKFRSSQEDVVNGNDFIHRAFGGKSGLSVKDTNILKLFLLVLIQHIWLQVEIRIPIGRYILS